MAAVAAGAVAVAAAGLFSVTQLAGGGGADSPEGAVAAFFDALAAEDLLGVLEALPPGERGALRPAVEQLAGELERLEILDDGIALDDIGGVDITVTGLELDSAPLADGIAAVTVTGGSIDFESVPDDLPIGDNLRNLIEEAGGEVGDEVVSDRGELTDDEIELVAVEEDGGWHVSLFYSLAEAARRDTGLDVPDFGAGVDPRGAASAEAAVEGLLRAAVDLDLEAAIAKLAPDEARALYDYAPLFLPDVEAAAAEARAAGMELALDDLDLGTEDAGAGATRVTIDGFRLSIAVPEEGALLIDFDGECARFEVDGEAVSAPDFFGSGPEEICLDGAGLVGSLAGVTTGLVTVERDGAHYVSPTRTMFDGVLQFVAALDTEDIEDPEALFELLFGAAGLGTGGFGPAEELENGSDGRFDEVVPTGDPTAPEGLGDDPDYQPLAEACFAGDLAACDDLYVNSPIGSDYEAYAQSCGGRLAPQDAVNGGCAERFGDPGAGDDPGDGPAVLEPQPPPSPSDPAFQPLVDACFGGDMQACDDAYIESDIGSPEEAYGLSCGGRRPDTDTVQSCAIQFGAIVVD